MFVYLLECTDNATYVGATVDVDRRLRQHNKEIKGGAHATGSKVAAGKSSTCSSNTPRESGCRGIGGDD